MGIKYEHADDLQLITSEMAMLLFPHVRMDSVVCLRSFGSTSRGTIARCHALGKAMQIALGRKGFYLVEVISERFDKLSGVDQLKTLIHELMHIPKSFGGGFIFHNVVNEKNVDKMYEKYICLKGRYGQPLFEKSLGEKSTFSREKVSKNQIDAYENNPLEEEEPKKEEKKKRKWW